MHVLRIWLQVLHNLHIQIRELQVHGCVWIVDISVL